MNKKLSIVNISLHILGFLFCIVPPAATTACYFPLWNSHDSGKALAGGGVLIATLCFFPIFKFIKRLLSSSSTYIMWLVLFIIFLGTSRIADEMTVIAFSGFAGNLIGALCFFIARRYYGAGQRL